MTANSDRLPALATLTRQQRRSCLYRNRAPAAPSRLQEALEACDVIDRAHDKPDERPVATCRFRLLSRDVRVKKPR
jgi:hypothetical protein